MKNYCGTVANQSCTTQLISKFLNINVHFINSIKIVAFIAESKIGATVMIKFPKKVLDNLQLNAIS